MHIWTDGQREKDNMSIWGTPFAIAHLCPPLPPSGAPWAPWAGLRPGAFDQSLGPVAFALGLWPSPPLCALCAHTA